MRMVLIISLVISSILAAKPLNVVFILADDLGFGELGCYGQKKILTPNIDRLASEGTRFTRHYTGAPVCAPARCIFLTGRHGGRAEIRGNLQANLSFPEFKEGQHPLSDEAITLAEVFQKAGYATAAIGKWGLGPVGSTGDPNRQGIDYFFGYNCQAVAHSYYPRFIWRNAEKIEINREPIPGHSKQPAGEVRMEDWIGETYTPDLMRTEAVNFIAKHKDQPFFLYLAFIEPHVAMHPPVERVNAYPAARDAVPYRGEAGYLPHPRPRAAYAAMISDLDAHVGAVRDALEKAGILDETLIVFTSDNGPTHPVSGRSKFHIGGCDPEFFNSTAGLKGYKGSLDEGGIRVPMIARLPGRVLAGRVDNTPGYFPDWFPTLCAAAGIEFPGDLDGVSLWPVLCGESAPLVRKKPMVWVFPEYGGQVAVMFGDLKVLRRGLNSKKNGPWEVYDVALDPGEKNNLAEEHREWIDTAIRVMRAETNENLLYPIQMPGPD